ncbi:MAG: MoxR family ATPase [Nitrospirota bacterium]
MKRFTNLTRTEMASGNEKIEQIIASVSSVIKGKDEVVRMAVVCLLARGHLLFEDIPGIGKTTLALALARSIGCSFSRIQFTSDLLPSDIIGTSIFDKNTGMFTFCRGPIFNQILLVDEINRATPKTQSALLEAMGEGQVSVEGKTYPLPLPFFVIATQNPREFYGTFPLPESQMDRFLMCLELGYPDDISAKEIIRHGHLREEAGNLQPIITPEEMIILQDQADKVHTADVFLDYVLAITNETRSSEMFEIGLSPRAALSLTNAAKVWAFMEGRDYCIPEDIKAVASPVIAHRLYPRKEFIGIKKEGLIRDLLSNVPVPV